MKIEKIMDYLDEATRADLLLTVLVLIIVITVIASIIYIAVYSKKNHKILKQELTFINRHLSHIDPNQYTTNYMNNQEQHLQ